MGGWSLLLPVLKHRLPLQALTRLMWTEGRRGRSPEREDEIVRLSSVLTRLRPPRFRSNCLERSLLAYRFLAQIDADPHLVIAVTTSQSGLLGHAWVTLDDVPIHDSAVDIDHFVPVGEFGARGLLLAGDRDGRIGRLKSWA